MGGTAEPGRLSILGGAVLALGLVTSPILSQPDPASQVSLDLGQQIAEAAEVAAQRGREAQEARAAADTAEQDVYQARAAAEAAGERLDALETRGRRARAERNAARAEVESLSAEAARKESIFVALEQEVQAADARAQEAQLRIAALEGQAAAAAAQEDAAAAQERAEAAEERARVLETEANASQAERDQARREAEALRAEAAEKEAARAATEREAAAAEARAQEAQTEAAEAEERAAQAQQRAEEQQQRAEALEEDLGRSRRQLYVVLAAGVLVVLAVLLVALRFARRRRLELEASETARRVSDEKLVAAITPAPLSCLLEGRDTEGRVVVVKVGAELLGLPEGVVVGRSPGRVDAVIEHQEASRRHFRLTVDDGTLFIADLHSTNGTYVNGKEVGADEPVPLANGDEIRVGAAIRLNVVVD